MKRIASEDGISEVFTDFTEFLTTCDERECNFGYVRTRYNDDDDWAGASYKQARNMLTHGYEKTVKAVHAKVNQLQKQGVTKPPTRVRDYVGFTPIVPNVILGIPKAMWNNKQVPKKSKVVTLVYDCGVSCCVSSEELAEHGAQVVSYVMNLERLGYRVRIDAIAGFSGSKTYMVRIPVKNENNPINLKRVSFPMTHVGMLRTLGFDWYERCPDAIEMGGYGTPLYCLNDDKRERLMKDVLGENEYYINYQMDVKDVFEGLDERM